MVFFEFENWRVMPLMSNMLLERKVAWTGLRQLRCSVDKYNIQYNKSLYELCSYI